MERYVCLDRSIRIQHSWRRSSESVRAAEKALKNRSSFGERRLISSSTASGSPR